tara:strand:+ start:2353 stop:2619 length:267 start_codon:yes stop_codon:yes gene_type:complete
MEDENFEVEYETNDIESSESETIDTSAEEDIEVEETPTLDMIDAIHDGNLRVAGEVFSDMLGDKIKSALDMERISMGQKMFASATSEE